MGRCGLTCRDGMLLLLPALWVLVGLAMGIYYFACPGSICPRTLPGCAAFASAIAALNFLLNLLVYHTRRAYSLHMLPERRRGYLIFKTFFAAFIFVAGIVSAVPFFVDESDKNTFDKADGFWMLVTSFWGLLWFVDLVCFHYSPSRLLGTVAHSDDDHDEGDEDARSLSTKDVGNTSNAEMKATRDVHHLTL